MGRKFFREKHKRTVALVLAALLLLSFSAFASAAEPAVSGGARFSLTLTGDGTAWAWGRGGPLGNDMSNIEYQATPVQVKDIHAEIFSGVVAVEAGDIFSVAIKDDGTVWTWGAHSLGRLGQGQHVRSTYPGKVEGLSDIIAVSANNHTLALKSDGTVWAWGYGAEGQIGDGERETRYEPVQVQGLTDVLAVSAGKYHSLALNSDGTVWAWGYGLSGELGVEGLRRSETPVQVDVLTDVIAISAGGSHNLALNSDGTVWAWGNGVRGVLGQGEAPGKDTPNKRVPVMVKGLGDVIAVAAGGTHSMALKSEGTVWAWGRNDEDQLGTGFVVDEAPYALTTPKQVENIGDAVAISAGGAYGEIFSLVIVQEDEEKIVLRIGQPSARVGGLSLYSWGENDYGQLGEGSTELRTSPVQVPIDLTPVMTLDVPPEIIDGRTVVPLRFIGEQLGASFEWEGETQQITYTKDDTTILLWIGENKAEVNGEELNMDVPPEIVDGRTVVPLRFIGEQLGASFEWDGATQTITITP